MGDYVKKKAKPHTPMTLFVEDEAPVDKGVGDNQAISYDMFEEI